MTTPQVSTSAKANTRQLAPLQLLIDLIRKKPSLEEAKQKAAFRKLILDDENEDYLHSLINEWLSIKFNGALNIAVPPARETVEQRRTEQARLVATIERVIKVNMLDMMLPNGKKLSNSTGRDCTKAGGLFAQIGMRVKPNEIVGKVLTEKDIHEMWEGRK